MKIFDNPDFITESFIKVSDNPIVPSKDEEIYVGLDLGTAYTVLVVLSKDMKPIAGNWQFAQVIRDGVVVDFIKAKELAEKLRVDLEKKIGRTLGKTAIAIPPGINRKDTNFISNVAEAAGFEVTNVVTEPEAANTLLKIENGVVVDIGGGTTGLAVVEKGKVVYTADEATGGTHCSLVIAGTYKISFEEAEEMKCRPEHSDEISRILRPVSQKIAKIIKTHISKFNVEEIYLVGGTSSIKGIENIIEDELGIKTYKPINPHFITPIGIAMNC